LHDAPHVAVKLRMNKLSIRPEYSTLFPVERRSWTRAIAAQALAAKHKTGASRIAAEIVKSTWPDDDRALAITKGAMTPTTSAGLWSWNPVGPFRSLAPSSAALSLFQMGMMLDLTGATTIRIPGAVPGTLPVFVGEGMPGPVVQRTIHSTILGPVRKILLFATATGELENSSPENASTIIGRILADAAERSIDATAFGTTADDGVTPAGLLHGVTPTAAATAGPDAMAQDLGALTGAIGAAGIDPNGAVFVCGPREATIIKTKASLKLDNPVLMTLGLPAKSVACFAPNGVASGYQDAPTIEAKTSAVLHHEDTAPADIGTGAGVAAPTKSVFQTNLIAIRVRANCAWVAAPGAAQVITAVNW
jgi:hypothetical protein